MDNCNSSCWSQEINKKLEDIIDECKAFEVAAKNNKLLQNRRVHVVPRKCEAIFNASPLSKCVVPRKPHTMGVENVDVLLNTVRRCEEINNRVKNNNNNIDRQQSVERNN